MYFYSHENRDDDDDDDDDDKSIYVTCLNFFICTIAIAVIIFIVMTSY
jgi:hypothetical protein